MKIDTLKLIFSLVLTGLLISCADNPTPRPYGYFRVDLPPHQYVRYDSAALPYRFDKPVIASIKPVTEKGENYWIDINYSTLKASIYCSYIPVRANLFNLLEDSRKIVYKHTVRADGISETPFENPGRKVYGILYQLSGNTASPAQFVLTDSSKHFFRGALYFEQVPNKDSIAPMADYIRKDIVQLMESFEWKNN
ncbi:MAG: gliding motility lipoprotein GldD [Paludibacteraceae bacterium]